MEGPESAAVGLGGNEGKETAEVEFEEILRAWIRRKLPH